MASLEKTLRNQLERTVKDARDIAEAGARAALEAMGVGEAGPPSHLNDEDRNLRRRLRIHGRQLGDERINEPTALAAGSAKGVQQLDRLIEEVAYEHWHRLLFASFLAENNLLMYPDPQQPVAVSLAECEDLAADEGARNGWELAARFAARMLPQIFRVDSPVFELELPPEVQQQLEKLISDLPVEVFTASDSLGWVYQFWQARRKEQVNESEVKIGARELPAVTQLFTEDYMVDFLLDNTLGAWWAGKRQPVDSFQCSVFSEETDVRNAVALPGCEWKYLRFIKTDPHQPPGVSPRLTPAAPDDDNETDDNQQPDANALRLMWRPAAGTFEGWPQTASDLKCLDPCMGSGHFIVAMFERLVAMRMAEEHLKEGAAVAAVIRDNLFGLEIDPRCTQIAAFNLALAAWRRVGYCVLPPMNLACSGLAPNTSKEDWLALAGDNEKLQGGMGQLYELFDQAPVLGSLINPRASRSDMYVATFHELQPLLDLALANEPDQPANQPQRDQPQRASVRLPRTGDNGGDGQQRGRQPDEQPGANARRLMGRVMMDDTAHEMAVTARGLAKAAELLACQFTLVATNVPYLGGGKQIEVLKNYCERVHPDAKADLATCFVERALSFCTQNGTVTILTPQNWLYLGPYKRVRERLLRATELNFVTWLGPKAFQTPMWDFNVVLVALTQTAPTRTHTIPAYDISEASTPTEKNAALQSCDVRLSPQKKQLGNPDSRVLFAETSSIEPLSNYAGSFKGLSTGDLPRFIFVFCEVPAVTDGWRCLQGSVSNSMPYGGKEQIILWEEGRGKLFNYVAERLGPNGTGAWLRGESAWNQFGVAVAQISSLRATLFSGDLFDESTAAIIPKHPSHRDALWVYCSTDEFREEVRKLDDSMKVPTLTLLKVPFDLTHWQKVAAEKYPHGLPKPFSSDPTQWLFNGHPMGSDQPLQVAVARLLGYQWPRQTGSSFPDCPALEPDGLEKLADKDGIVCISPVRGESSAADRLLNLLAAAYDNATHQPPGVSPRFPTDDDKQPDANALQVMGDKQPDANALRVMGDKQPDANALRLMDGGWSTDVLNRLLADAGYAGKSLETWLRDGFFTQHLDVFHKRPFIWHIWDGLRDGFSALINYHKLDKKNLETLIYTYLGDWITRCEANDKENGLSDDGEKTAAAKRLKRSLELILEGEAPYDIFVRWKPLHQQPIGWNPDLNDGVRMNIRPFVSVPDVKTKGAGILRANPKIKWDKDRGKEPKRSKEEFPWFWGWDGKTTDFAGIGTEPTCERFNDCHYTLKTKKSAAGR